MPEHVVDIVSLQNIIDDFVLPSVISSEEIDDLVEVAAILINEYIYNHINPSFMHT
jgi:hypothetical protein